MGSFENISLKFTPQFPPLSVEERSLSRPNYPTVLAYLHVYIDGNNVTEQVPSAYMLWLLDHMLSGFPDLFRGNCVVADWDSDPWRFDLKGELIHDRIYITLHVPGKWVAMKNVSVPLSKFGRAVIRLAHEWKDYLLNIYAEEILDPVKGSDYQSFLKYLRQASQIQNNYENQL